MSSSIASPEASGPPTLIRLLADDVRWALLRALARGDHQVNELVDRLGQPMNLVSYHLKKLRAHGLVTARRSEADARDVYYTLDLERLRRELGTIGPALHPALATVGGPAHPFDPAHLPPRRVLFVCTHNSARSQMAEGLLRHLSGGRLEVTSAGSHPTVVHPDAIRTLAGMGIDIRAQRTRSLDDVRGQTFDTVITVCDRAREVCPTFPGEGERLHWGFPDPAAIADDEARAAAFERTARGLQTRIAHFLSALTLFTESEEPG
jgi:protein-tyrosine-phosphatase/DNA-binding transcriptional ArsR family regulator